MSSLPSTSPRLVAELQSQNVRAEELMVSNPREALAMAREAHASACAHEITLTQPTSLWLQGIALGLLAQMEESDALLTEATELAERYGQPALQYRAINGLATNAHQRGEYGRAFSQYHQYLSWARQAGDPLAEARALGNIGLLFHEMGEYARSAEIVEQVLAIGRALDRPLLCVVQATNMGQARIDLREFSAALDIVDCWLPVAQRHGFHVQAVLLLAVQGAAKLGLGRPDDALKDLEAAVQEGRRLGDFHEICGPLIDLGEAYHAVGRHDAALQVLNEAVRRCDQVDSLALEAKASRVLVSLHQSLGQFAEALAHAQTLLRLQDHVHTERMSRRTEVLAVEFEIDQLRQKAELERQKMHELQQSNALLHRLQENLQHEATHDYLTGLYNRRYFLQLLEATLVASLDGTRRFGLAFLDLDGFKQVNDTHGHPAGDALLVEIAQRVLRATRSGDVVARLGGDEFAIIMHDIGSSEGVQRHFEKIAQSICESFPWCEGCVRCSVSVGVAIFPRHGRNAAELLHHADAAMYRQKRERQDYSSKVEDA
jgi:diguanylate cyclase (GGDEF)-like protein